MDKGRPIKAMQTFPAPEPPMDIVMTPPLARPNSKRSSDPAISSENLLCHRTFLDKSTSVSNSVRTSPSIPRSDSEPKLQAKTMATTVEHYKGGSWPGSYFGHKYSLGDVADKSTQVTNQRMVGSCDEVRRSPPIIINGFISEPVSIRTTNSNSQFRIISNCANTTSSPTGFPLDSDLQGHLSDAVPVLPRYDSEVVELSSGFENKLAEDIGFGCFFKVSPPDGRKAPLPFSPGDSSPSQSCSSMNDSPTYERHATTSSPSPTPVLLDDSTAYVRAFSINNYSSHNVNYENGYSGYDSDLVECFDEPPPKAFRPGSLNGSPPTELLAQMELNEATCHFPKGRFGHSQRLPMRRLIASLAGCKPHEGYPFTDEDSAYETGSCASVSVQSGPFKSKALNGDFRGSSPLENGTLRFKMNGSTGSPVDQRSMIKSSAVNGCEVGSFEHSGSLSPRPRELLTEPDLANGLVRPQGLRMSTSLYVCRDNRTATSQQIVRPSAKRTAPRAADNSFGLLSPQYSNADRVQQLLTTSYQTGRGGRSFSQSRHSAFSRLIQCYKPTRQPATRQPAPAAISPTATTSQAPTCNGAATNAAPETPPPTQNGAFVAE